MVLIKILPEKKYRLLDYGWAGVTRSPGLTGGFLLITDIFYNRESLLVCIS
jgi:hypothetical protein